MLSVLAIDSGNSFLKWGYSENNQWLTCNKIHNQSIDKLSENWKNLEHPDIVVISQVSGHAIRQQLLYHLKIWNTQPHWITALPKQCGVTNGYADPCQLGSDRWAALIAAWNRFHQSCLVVNIGTGMTIDVLSENGVFLGGIIVPGPYSLMNCIDSNTQINLEESNCRYEIFPVNTANALYSGVIQSLTGAIERMVRLYNLQHDCVIKHCVFSGGGVADILPHIDFDYEVIENLVLDGLVLIAQDMQQRQ